MLYESDIYEDEEIPMKNPNLYIEFAEAGGGGYLLVESGGIILTQGGDNVITQNG